MKNLAVTLFVLSIAPVWAQAPPLNRTTVATPAQVPSLPKQARSTSDQGQQATGRAPPSVLIPSPPQREGDLLRPRSQQQRSMVNTPLPAPAPPPQDKSLQQSDRKVESANPRGREMLDLEEKKEGRGEKRARHLEKRDQREEQRAHRQEVRDQRYEQQHRSQQMRQDRNERRRFNER